MLLVPTMNQWPITSIKADESSEKCEEHTEHTEECGYKEPTEEIPCTHVHDDNCGYDPETGTGCSHIHDENCGYVEASEGSPCTFVCNSDDDNQAGEDSENTPKPIDKVSYINELIATLSSVADYETMSKADIEASYADVKTAYELFQALDTEAKAQVIDSYKLIELMTYIKEYHSGLNALNDQKEDFGVITSLYYPNKYTDNLTKNETLQQWTSKGKASEIQVYIEDADMEWSYDIIYIGGADGNAIVNSKDDQNFKGKTFYIPGDTVTVWMTSDSSNNHKGYRIELTPIYPSDTFEMQLEGAVYLKDTFSEPVLSAEPFSFSLYQKLEPLNFVDPENDSYGELLDDNLTNDSNGMINLPPFLLNAQDAIKAGFKSGKFQCTYTILQNIPDDFSYKAYGYDDIIWTITIPIELTTNSEGLSSLNVLRSDIKINNSNSNTSGGIDAPIYFINFESRFNLCAEKVIQLQIESNSNDDSREPNADETFEFQLSVYSKPLTEQDLENQNFKPESEEFTVLNEVQNQNSEIDFGEITTYFDNTLLPEWEGNQDLNYLLYKIEETNSSDYSALTQGYYILLKVNRNTFGVWTLPKAYAINSNQSFCDAIQNNINKMDSLQFQNYKALTQIKAKKFINQGLYDDTFNFQLFSHKIVPDPSLDISELSELNTDYTVYFSLDGIGELIDTTTNAGYFIEFPNIYYTEEDLTNEAGEPVDSVMFIYSVKEVDKDGYTSDGRILQYLIKLSNENGILVARELNRVIVWPDGSAAIPNEWNNPMTKWAFFNNTGYHLSGEIWMKYDLSMNNNMYKDDGLKEPSADEKFTFYVYPYNELIMTDNINCIPQYSADLEFEMSNFSEKPILTAQNEGSSIDFGIIDYANDSRLNSLSIGDIGLLFYRIAEEPSENYKVTFDQYLELYVKKTASDNVDLLAINTSQHIPPNTDSIKYDKLDRTSQILFVNTYPHIVLRAEKYVNFSHPDADEVFTFDLYRKVYNPTETSTSEDYGEFITSTTNKGISISFPEIRYSMNDFEQGETEKYYEYTIVERQAEGYFNSTVSLHYIVHLENTSEGINVSVIYKESWEQQANADGTIVKSSFSDIGIFNNLRFDVGAKVQALMQVNKQFPQSYDRFEFTLDYLFRVKHVQQGNTSDLTPLIQVERKEHYQTKNTFENINELSANVQFTTKPYSEVMPNENYAYIYLMQETPTNNNYIQDSNLWLAFVLVSTDTEKRTIAYTDPYIRISSEDELTDIHNAVLAGTITNDTELLKYINNQSGNRPDTTAVFDNYRTFIEINATKTVNGHEPSEDDVFDFKSTPIIIIDITAPLFINADSNHINTLLQSSSAVHNQSGSVLFHLDYSKANSEQIVLSILEESSQNDDIYTIDDTKYLVETQTQLVTLPSRDKINVPLHTNIYKISNWTLVQQQLEHYQSEKLLYSEILDFCIQKGYLKLISPDEVVFRNLKKITGVTAKKIWKLNNGGKATESVTISLLKDGVKYDSKELNEANNWQYTWDNLPMANWTVEEVNPPKGFTVSIAQIGNEFIIINDDIGDSVDPIDPEPDKSDKPDKPVDPDKPDKPVDPDNPVVPDTVPDNPNNDSNQPYDPNYNTIDENGIPTGAEHPSDDLPLTGQLWWPVWILALLGFTMIAVGLFVKRRQHEQNEK